MERSENAATHNQLFVWIDVCLFWLNFSSNYHGFMLSIHGKAYYIVSGHTWQLLGDDVFEINQVPHRSELSIEY